MQKSNFGEATKYTFKNQNGIVMSVIDFGAILVDLIVPDKKGNLVDVALGYDDCETYKIPGGPNFGGTIGRNGNRIGGARFMLNGKTYTLDQNNNGNNLHSGCNKYNYRMWDVKETTDNSITLSMNSPDGDQGFPGNAVVEVTYTLTEEDEVRIDYYAVSDEDTIMNLTNHSYFNLSGHDSGDILEQEVWIHADAFLPTDNELIPTGEICPVEGTPMDFRQKKAVGRDIEEDYEALNFGLGYDHNWCLNDQGTFRKVAEATALDTGITMEVYTDLPGVQFYCGNFLENEPGKHGATYQKRQGMCFETQGYPDAINHENFPSPICKKGQEYRTTTVYKFV